MSTKGGATRQPCASIDAAALRPRCRARSPRCGPRGWRCPGRCGRRAASRCVRSGRTWAAPYSARLAIGHVLAADRDHRRLDPEHRGEARGRQRLAGDASATSMPRSITTTRSAKRAASVRSCMMARIAFPAWRGLAQQFHHGELVARIERGGRLVGEQDRRLRGERAGERDARPLAAGQGGHGAVGEGFRLRRRERARDRGAVLGGRRPRTHRHAARGRASRSTATGIGQWNTWPCGR